MARRAASWIIAAVVVVLPVAALAQAPAGAAAPPPPTGSVVPPSTGALVNVPNDFPHPMMPWDYYAPIWQQRSRAFGHPVRYVEILARRVPVRVAVLLSERLPLEWRDEIVTIPGYSVTETTTGYIYPPRWTLEQRAAGVYQWRMLPAEFRRK
jgi:hypothetical protein